MRRLLSEGASKMILSSKQEKMLIPVSKVKCCKVKEQKDGRLKCEVHNDYNLRISHFRASPELTYMVACATYHKELFEECENYGTVSSKKIQNGEHKQNV